MTDDIKAIRQALGYAEQFARNERDALAHPSNDDYLDGLDADIANALAALDRIEAQKPRVPMAMLEELVCIHLHPSLMKCDRKDILREIAGKFGVEASDE